MGRRSHKVKPKETVSQIIKLPRSWDYYERFNQSYLYPFKKDKIIEIKQTPLGPRIGSCVWDTSIVMSKYFELEIGEEFLKGKRIIELGSGVGLLGITLSLLGADDIELTDQKCMHDILKENVELNCGSKLIGGGGGTKKKGIRGGTTKVSELWWGSDVTSYNPPFDLIVGSDLMYEDDCVDLLLTSLLDLSSIHPPQPKINNVDDIQDDNNNNNNNNQENENKNEDNIDNINNNSNNEKDDLDGNSLKIEELKIKEDNQEKEEETVNNNNNNDNNIDKIEIPPYEKAALLEASPNTLIYLGYEHREMTAESLFMNQVYKYFDVEIVSRPLLLLGFISTHIIHIMI
eukprot:gene6714-8323_t